MPLQNTLMWASSVSLLLGTAPVFYAVWTVWRLLTLAFHRSIYEAGDDFLYSLYQKLVLFFFETCSGIELRITGDIDEVTKKKENVVFISNHQCTVDWAVADMLAIRQNSIGHIRYILKDSLKYLPFYGSYFRQHGCIYVRRSGQFRSDKAVEQLDSLASSTMPFWLVVFPEGTRYNPNLPQVIAKSQSFAKANGLPVLKQVLIPRSKAVRMCVDRLRGRIDAIYDVTIAYSSTRNEKQGLITRVAAPTLSQYLGGACRQLHIHIQRIAIDSVPVDDDELNSWLVDLFQEKERLLEQFYSPIGTLSSRWNDCSAQKLPISETVPAFIFWLILMAPLWFTLVGIKLYLWICLIGALLGVVWLLLL